MKLDCKCIVNFGEIKDQPGSIRLGNKELAFCAKQLSYYHN